MPLGVARVILSSSLARLEDKQGNSKEMRNCKPVPIPQELGGWGKVDVICSPLLPVPHLQCVGRAPAPVGLLRARVVSLYSVCPASRSYVPAVIGLATLNRVWL